MRSAYGEKLKLPGLRNGGRVNDFLFRGAQPREEGMPELKKLGVTTIVDLRGEDPGTRDRERQQAETALFRAQRLEGIGTLAGGVAQQHLGFQSDFLKIRADAFDGPGVGVGLEHLVDPRGTLALCATTIGADER